MGVVDLDGCRNPHTGALTPWADQVIRTFASYTEVSPSGTGVHIFASGVPTPFPKLTLKMPGDAIDGKRPQMEAFANAHYCTVTGDRLSDAASEIRAAPEAWAWLQQWRYESRRGKHKNATNIAAEGRNGALLSMGCRLQQHGASDDAIHAAITDANFAGNLDLHKNFAEGALPEQEVNSIIRSVLSYPKGKSDQRTVVFLRAGDLHEQADAAEDALIAAKVPVYTQGGSLVRSVVEEADAARGRRTLITRIIPCQRDWLLRKLSEEICCIKQGY
jgi:hypothetical protein